MRTTRLASLLPLLLAPGCAGNAIDVPNDAGQPTPDLTQLADLAQQPDLAPPLRPPGQRPDPIDVPFNGGALLKSVDVVTVVWQGDTLAQQRADFASWMVTSPYFDQLQEYGVGEGTAEGPFSITDAPVATLDDSAIGPLLRAKIADGTLPAPSENTLYVLYLPAGMKSTMDGGQGCSDYGGYHWFTSTGHADPERMAYAVVPKCAGSSHQFNSDTVVASHEIGEAATDPTGGGFVNLDVPESEIGDLCTPLHASLNVTASDGSMITYRVSRLWSKKTAAAGNSNPCLPAPASPYVYFNAAVDSAEVDLTLDANSPTTTTFNIEPFAMGDVGDIQWMFFISPQSDGLTFSAEQGDGVAGSTQPVTITADPSTQSGIYSITVYSQAGMYSNVWYATLNVD